MSKPKTRFNGFTEDWEQRKALELAEYSKGNGYSKGDLTETGTPIILYGRLYTKYQFVIDEVDAKKAQGKSVVHIHNSDIQEVTISYPLRAEQDQIVAVFRTFDHLITLHQRKCDELKNMKKFMFQNMFV